MEIHLCGFHALMTKPKSDHRVVYTGLKQLHCCAVAKYMGRDTFVFQRRTKLAGSSQMFCKQMSDSVHSQRTAAGTGKQGLRWLGITLTTPDAQCLHCILAKRGTTFLASFPQAAYVGSTAEDSIFTVKADQL